MNVNNLAALANISWAEKLMWAALRRFLLSTNESPFRVTNVSYSLSDLRTDASNAPEKHGPF